MLGGAARIDACRSQALQMTVTLPCIYHVDGPVAALKPVLDEGKQHAVLFVGAVEKRADVTYVAQLGTGQGNWRRGLRHGVYLDLLWIARETGRQRRLLSTAPMNSMRLSKPNVYQTLVLFWRHMTPGHGSMGELRPPQDSQHLLGRLDT